MYWEREYKFLTRAIQRDQFEVIEGAKRLVIRVQRGKYRVMYAVVCPTKLRPLSWLYLWRQPEWKALEVIQVFTFPDAQGQGLARLLYEASVNIIGEIVMSGTTHTSSSRKLWEGFVRDGVFNVSAWNVKNLRERGQVHWEDGELQSDLELYEKKPMATRDVRLIATRNSR
jgi:GNAT superfamily N-acetyltransferase